MPDLWFVMPVHERVDLTLLCLDHLADQTINQLFGLGLAGQCVVVGDNRRILEHATDLGFWTVERENEPLGRKFNDGFQLAYDQGADYIVPLGSDNWVMADLFGDHLPAPGEVRAHREATIVHEDGQRLCEINVTYPGGDGIRIFPRELISRVSGRPAYDHRRRAVDASIAENLKRKAGWSRRFIYHDIHPHQVVGWQSHSVQLNDYADLAKSFGRRESTEPWLELSATYNDEHLDRMQELFARRRHSR